LSEVNPLIVRVTEKLSIDQSSDNPVDKFQWIPYGKSVLNIGPDSSDAGISALQNNLATVLQALGDYAGAKALLQKSVASDERNFGKDHPSTARRYSNLATVLKDLGDYAGALALSGRSVCIFKKSLPAGHPSIQTVSNIYQSILDQMKS